jgi:hypothetical protein
MAIGSGLAASLGVSPESVYGTYVAPARFPQVTKAEVKKVKSVVQGGGIAAGRMLQGGARRVVPTEAGTCQWEQEVTNKSMGLFLGQLMGGAAAPVQQLATAAYLQTHPLVDNVGKSMTVQLGVPDTTGTVRPYTGIGAKLTTAEFSCAAGELLKASFEADLQRVIESQVLAAPSYVAGLVPFHFAHMAVKLGTTFGAEAVVSGVKGAQVKIERPQDTERFYAGAAVPGTKAEPLMNDNVSIAGSFDVDLVNKADFADRFAADSSAALIVEWVFPTAIASTYFPTFRIRVPMVFFDDGTPTVDGNGITSTTYAFVAQYDETNAPATLDYLSTDLVL